VVWKSKLIHDVNLVALFVFAILANRVENQMMIVILNLLAGQSLAWTVNFSHNFAHQADNWRRYSMNLSLITWRDFRVFHILVRKFIELLF
jgi:positive regulator of sigma E activity